MANFPTDPVIGTVYTIDGSAVLCTGVKRFKYLPEFTTFATVAAMKAGIVPANHRCKCVRYVDGGKVIDGLEYYSRGVGWPVTADGYVNHVDSKGNFLELQLIENTVSLDHTGADNTGTLDAAPHLRAAMARLLQNNGGELIIPAGTYYLNSGDPRGLKIIGTPDFYTVCEIVDNVTVRGYGDKSILKYNSNRIGVVPATSNGDGGAIFANFRVRSPANTPYACTNFNVDSFKVIYTPLTNQTVDYIDGQIVRVLSLNGLVTNGVFWANNINASNPAGQQVFSYEKVDLFSSRLCRFFNMGKAVNAGSTDVSLYYITGTKAIITENLSVGSTAVDDNATFIELHTNASTVTDNICFGMNTFINVVSQVTHPGPEYDFSEFRIQNNYARNIRNFVVDWVANVNRKSLVSIKDNGIIFRATAATDVESLIRHAAIFGPADLPTETVVIEGNTITVAVSGGGAAPVQYSTGFDSLIRHQYCKAMSIKDNEFKNIRRGVLMADGVKLEELTVRDNDIEFGLFGNNTEDLGGEVSRSGVIINFQTGTALQKVIIRDNEMQSKYSGSASNHGFMSLNSGGAIAAVIEINGNNILGTKGEELSATVFGGNSHAADTIDINHRVSLTYSASALAGMYPNFGVSAIRAGSSVSYENDNVVVTRVGSAKEFTIFGKRDAAPTSGYFSAGSWIHNTGSGVLGWKCDVSGTPGTWVAKG